jgi:CHAT domain
MARKIGGLDELDFQNATARLAQAKSTGHIKQLIENDRVFSHPTLHRLWIAKLHEELAPLKDRIDLFFQLLALRVHRDIFDAVPRLSTEQQSRPANRLEYRPPFFAGLMELLGDAVPKNQEWTLDPTNDFERITFEVSEALGREVALPLYAPLNGSLWNAIVVVCAACRRMRVDVRAYYVDLVTASQLQTPLAEGILNHSRCPHCGEIVTFPLRIWISEHPFAPDTLSGMSCIWRSTSGAMVFQPPAGAQRRAENDHLLMYRAMAMLLPYRWPSLAEDGERTVSVNVTVAYSDEDLRRLILKDEFASGGLPRSMKALWDYTAADMRSGQYPFHASEARVIEQVLAEKQSGDWTFFGLEPLGNMEAFRRLAMCFIREAVARKTERAPAVRAFLAGETCGAYRNLGQLALARAALARAQELLAHAESSTEREYAEMTLRFERGELSAAAGDNKGSSGFFKEVRETIGTRIRDTESRLAMLNVMSLEALESKQQEQYHDAIPRLLETIAGWEELLDELTADTASQEMKTRLRSALSADLANLGGTFQDVARYLRLIRIVNSVVQGKMPNLDDAQFLKLSGLQPSHALKVVDHNLLATLDAIFPEGVSERALLMAATSLLERALSLSVMTASWDFVAIQGNRLAYLYLLGGDQATALKRMESAVEAAARISDYSRLVAGNIFLAEIALNEGDGTAGLVHLREAARHHLRQLISSGHEAQTDSRTLALIRFFAHRSLDRGGDKVQAALIVESLKAVTTASSMITGRPDQVGAVAKENSRVVVKMREREELRLRSIWQSGVKDQIDQQIHILNAEIAQESASASLLDERFVRWVSAIEFDLADIDTFIQRLARLGPQTTLLGACPLEGKLWVYTIWPGGSETAVVELTEPALLTGGWTGKDMGRLARVAELLLLPVDRRLRELQPEDVLVISLAEDFANLPISALPYHEGVLCENVTLCFVQGLAMLEACLDRPRLAYRSVLSLGAPSRPELPDLPGALAEAEAVAGLFKSNHHEAICLTGVNATSRAFAKSSAECDVVHIACHAERVGSTGEGLALMLTTDPRHRDSGILAEKRILAEVAVRDGSFVNLSGCATGLQGDTGAELMSGLVPVFLVAGAGCVAASLWPIEDGPAARFQRRFYTELLANADPLKSLARVQRCCISGELGSDMECPQVWAAYQLFGSGGGS